MSSTLLTPIIIKGLIGIFAAIVGYALREYQNRIAPFFQIYHINDEALAGWKEVSIPEEIIEKLKNTFYIKQPEPKGSFNEAYKCWDRCDDVKKLWPDLSSLVQKILDARNQKDLEKDLFKILERGSLNQWLTLLVVRSDIKFTPLDENLPDRTKVDIDYKDKERNGVIWFSTSYGATQFGQQMNIPAMEGNFEGFISNLKKLDMEKIKQTFKKFKEIMESEYQAALQVHGELKKILESYSLWQYKVAFTNLSKNPIMIEKEAIVVIKDRAAKANCAPLTPQQTLKPHIKWSAP